MIIVITGPSGSGKTTIRRILKGEYGIPTLENVTTRGKRPGERDGVDYLFVTVEEFKRMIGEGLLLEWTEYSGHFYGLKRPEAMEGLTVLETEGAKNLKKMFPEKIRIVYLEVPEETRKLRMLERGDDPDEADKRLQGDRERFEISGFKSEADLVVNNTDINRAVKSILSFMKTG